MPGFVAGVMPWLLTGWDSTDPPRALVVGGALLIAAGTAVLLHAFARFVLEGIGTPAPVAPTEQLVVGGAYRYVRNPMYLAVGSVIAGQALLLGRPSIRRVHRGGSPLDPPDPGGLIRSTNPGNGVNAASAPGNHRFDGHAPAHGKHRVDDARHLRVGLCAVGDAPRDHLTDEAQNQVTPALAQSAGSP